MVRNEIWLQKVRIPFFFKQWGGVRKKQNGKILDGRIWNEFPSRLALA
jgi:protein gp37